MFKQHNHFLKIVCLGLWTTAMHKSNKENTWSNLEPQYHKFCHWATISQVLSLPSPFQVDQINTNQLQIKAVCYIQWFLIHEILLRKYCKWLGNLYKGRSWEGLADQSNYTVMWVECLALRLKVVRKVWHQYTCITLPQFRCKILKSWAFILTNPSQFNVVGKEE